MRALFIGGTGTISGAITQLLAGMSSWELFLLNRGNMTNSVPKNVKVIQADIHNYSDVAEKVKGMSFDVVCDFIGYFAPDVERDYRLFAGKTKDGITPASTKQYIFISTASAYQKPPKSHIITENTPLENPYWAYSRGKIVCEEFLMEKYNDEGFPVTIVRPSHTYGDRSVPIGVKGKKGSWQVLKRMMEGKPVIVHGDGTSLWTMTHNSDFAKAFVGLMGNPKAIGEAFHITSDESLTWNNIYQCMASALGVEAKLVHVSSEYIAKMGPDYDLEGSLLGDKANTVIFDNSKIKSLVPDYKATMPFAKGIKQTMDYILKHPELQVPDSDFDMWCDRLIDMMK